MGKLFFVGRVVLFTISNMVPEKNVVPAWFPISPDTLGPSMCYLYTILDLDWEWVYQISALIGYSVTSQLCFYSVSRIGQIFFGRFLNFSQFFYLFFLLLLCFSLFSIKISHFFFFRKKITAFEVNSKIFDNRIVIDCVFLG